MDGSRSDDEKDVIQRTWKRKQEISYKEAFRNGALEGKDAGFEVGFGVGYKAGFESGYSVGVFNGIKKILEFYKTTDDIIESGFVNIQNGICYLCAENNKNDLQNVKDISTGQSEFLNNALKSKPSYAKLVDKYVATK